MLDVGKTRCGVKKEIWREVEMKLLKSRGYSSLFDLYATADVYCKH